MSKSTTITDAQLGAAVRTVFAALFSGVAAGAVVQAAAPEAPKEEPKPDPKPSTDSGSGSSTPDQAKGDEPAGLTQADVLKRVLAYAGKNGKAAAEEILAKFDATKVSELDAGNYQAVLDAIDAADLG